MITGGKTGDSSMEWWAPTKTDKFKVRVYGQISCGNGGDGEPIDFSAGWEGEVIYYEYRPQDKVSGPLGNFTRGSLAPPEPSGTPKDLQVSRGQRITFSTVWSDTDSRRRFGSEGDWENVPGVGPYKITISSNNPEVFVDENLELNTTSYTVGGGYSIQSPNLYVHVGMDWDQQPFTITISISDEGDVPEGSEGIVRDTAPTNHIRNFVNAGPYIPKRLVFLTSLSEPNTEGTHTNPSWKAFRNYYQASPASPREPDDPPTGASRAFYTNQLIDDHLAMSPIFSFSDLKEDWIIENGISTAQEAFNIS